MKEFHQRLKEVLKEKGISQTELCIRTGIPKSAMSQYISGSFRPKQERTHAIARALGVSEEWLRGQSSEKNEKEMEVELSKETIMFALLKDKLENESSDDIAERKEEITDEIYEEVKQFAEMVMLREETKKKNREKNSGRSGQPAKRK